jgi:hypothetical protein
MDKACTAYVGNQKSREKFALLLVAAKNQDGKT